jgi:hypothetical protein
MSASIASRTPAIPVVQGWRTTIRREARAIRGVGISAGVLAALGSPNSALASDPKFLGNWARGDGKTHVQIERCGSHFCGAVATDQCAVSQNLRGIAGSPRRALNWSYSRFSRRQRISMEGGMPDYATLRTKDLSQEALSADNGRHARPGSLETPAMRSESIFSVSAKHVYWTVRQLGRPAAGYLQASVRFQRRSVLSRFRFGRSVTR